MDLTCTFAGKKGCQAEKRVKSGDKIAEHEAAN